MMLFNEQQLVKLEAAARARKAKIDKLVAEAALLGLTVHGLPPVGQTSDGKMLAQPSPIVGRGERPSGLTIEQEKSNRQLLAEAEFNAEIKDEERKAAANLAAAASTPPRATQPASVTITGMSRARATRNISSSRFFNPSIVRFKPPSWSSR